MAVVDFTVPNNADWSLTFALVDDETELAFDLTGYSATMQLRSPPDADKAHATFSTESGTLIVSEDPAEGEIELRVPAGLAYGIPAGSYNFDMILIGDGGDRIRAVVGTATVEQGVSR